MSLRPSRVTVRVSTVVLGICGAIAFWPAAHAQTPEPRAAVARPSDTEIEQFLMRAKVIKTRSAGKGITASIRATMTDGGVTHDAHIQTIDESKREFRGTTSTEFNFRDSWSFNVAAYRISRLIGLDLVPVSVARRWKTSEAAYTWWVDDVAMDEADRLKKKVTPPDNLRWNEQIQLVRLFDQLIANVDRNLGNLLITTDWNLWAIDHTRAFRTQPTLKTPGNIARCDRQVLERLKQLDRATLKTEVGQFLQNYEIDAMLKRRDAIVELIEQRGPNAVFDRRPR
jgi:hypothetical protein